MTDTHDSDFIESQLKVANWHLDKTTDADPHARQYHIACARRGHQILMELLPTMAVSGTRRMELITELAALRQRLQIAGAEW